jgi:hypothetical protein
MGTVHDTHMTQFIPPACIAKSAGTWTPGINSNVLADVRGAGAGACILLIPVLLPSNGLAMKGALLQSLDVFFKIATAAASDFATVELEKASLKADGQAVSGAAVTCSLDSGNDTAAKRKAIGDHTLTVTLAAPAWIDDQEAYTLQCAVDCAATTVFTLLGARANYTLRV